MRLIHRIVTRIYKPSWWYSSLLLLMFILSACGIGNNNVSTPEPNINTNAQIATSSQLIDAINDAGIPQVGELAPDFQYIMSDGSTHKLSELRGKKVLLNFWATWCAPCRSEMPALSRALDEARDSVVILGINKAEMTDVITPFATELHVNFPLISNSSSDIANRYGALLLPTSYFINSDGTIALRKTGEMDFTFIKTHLSQLK